MQTVADDLGNFRRPGGKTDELASDARDFGWIESRVGGVVELLNLPIGAKANAEANDNAACGESCGREALGNGARGSVTATLGGELGWLVLRDGDGNRLLRFRRYCSGFG